MKVSVYDTYVPKDDNNRMHFDILVEEGESVENVYKYGKTYLNQKGIPDFELTTNECNFCHMETVSVEIEKEIRDKGYYILEMENCN
ncbi:DUF2024 family protein [Flavivirga eckloniae]|uniref:DUF2024 domain-containing protein n=1 Tax=Flavivirga eckloniae TaxID=1803846 RepID=A0A2K9PSX6_9FLAO|nr:DUF2024 family protein [Flavivirga eckloniae]AUP80170.1 DUF2024 domain-containing protein [Flavivirga eckloniae]